MVTVLIIEDEIQLLQNLDSFLSSFGGEFEVYTATSGEEGLEILESIPGVDMVLTDVRLPGIDGIEIVRTVSANYPKITVVVMTAFGSSELRQTALSEGALVFIEKPVDLDELAVTLYEAHDRRKGRTQEVGGLTILDVAEVIAISGESRLIHVRTEYGQGAMAFDRGAIIHCSTAKNMGSEALFTMAQWGEGFCWEVYDVDLKSYPINVNEPTNELLEEAARRVRDLHSSQDLWGLAVIPGPAQGQHQTQGTEKGSNYMAIRDHLTGFEDIEGFQGAAVFTAQGEMIEGIAKGKLDVKTTGMFANNALLNAQKATDQMGVGRGNLMQIRAPKAVVLMRCLNEATDFAATKEGKAHFHVVVVMDPQGNTGMASMIIDKCVGAIAEEMR